MGIDGHRAGILLALGWALLLPPQEENGSRASTARWQHAGWFVSAEQCERVRAELIAGARRRLGDPWMIPDPGAPARVEQNPSWADSRCLPREDPRPGRSTRD